MCFSGLLLFIYTKQYPEGSIFCMLKAFGNRWQGITGDMTPHRSRQGEASSGGTISFLPPIRGKPLNVCGNHQTFGHQVLKSSKINYFFGGLGAILAKYVKMASQKRT